MLKQLKFIFSQFWKLETKIKTLAASVSCEASLRSFWLITFHCVLRWSFFCECIPGISSSSNTNKGHIGLRLYPYDLAAAAAAESLQSCPTLCDPIDSSPPGSRIPGILQARTLEWVAISFSNAWKWNVKLKSLSCVRLFMTPWTAAYQAPLSMGFSRKEYWSGVPSPSLNPGVRALQFHCRGLGFDFWSVN